MEKSLRCGRSPLSERLENVMAHRHKNRKHGRNHTHAVKPANIRPAGMPPKASPAPAEAVAAPAPEATAAPAAS